MIAICLLGSAIDQVSQLNCGAIEDTSGLRSILTLSLDYYPSLNPTSLSCLQNACPSRLWNSDRMQKYILLYYRLS